MFNPTTFACQPQGCGWARSSRLDGDSWGLSWSTRAIATISILRFNGHVKDGQGALECSKLRHGPCEGSCVIDFTYVYVYRTLVLRVYEKCCLHCSSCKYIVSPRVPLVRIPLFQEVRCQHSQSFEHQMGDAFYSFLDVSFS